MARPLSPEQLAALRAVPLGTLPNRVDIALAMTQAKQGDIVEAFPQQFTATVVSRIVTGTIKNVDPGHRALIAAFFGCHVDDLWPTVREEAHAE